MSQLKIRQGLSQHIEHKLAACPLSGMDGRLRRTCEVAVMVMEALPGMLYYRRNLLGWLETRLAQITLNDISIY